MTSPISAAPGAPGSYPSSEYGAASCNYQYDLKLEVGISTGVDTVSVNAIFVDFLKRMTVAAGHPLSVFDTLDNPVSMDPPPDGADFKINFCVEIVEGKKRKILLGFKLESPTPMSTLKHRMFAYLLEHNLFLRVHHGGFAHGIHSAYLGYLIEEAPTAVVINQWTRKLQIEMQLAWHHPDAITPAAQTDISQNFPDFATPHKVTFPITIEKAKLMATNSDGKKIDTHGLYISTPVAYAEAVKTIFDGIILHMKTMPALVPSALRRENA
jgi:hypothetical protein